MSSPSSSLSQNTEASSFFTIALTPQIAFPFTVSSSARLLHQASTTTTLVLVDNFWGKAHGYTVKDAISGSELFRVESSISDVASSADTKWLVNAEDKVLIAHLSRTLKTKTAVVYDLHVGQNDDQKQRLTQIEVDLLLLNDEPCKVTVELLGTSSVCTVGVYGLWCERLAYLYLERGTEEREAITKVVRPGNNGDGEQVPFGDGEYHVQVAPGVDAAFIILVCAAMDDAFQQAFAKTT